MKIMNLTLLMCCYAIIMISQSVNAEFSLAEKRVEFNGELVPKTHPRHPHNLCKEAVNNQRAYWMMPESRVEICENKIKCALYGEVVKILDQPPEDGAQCNYSGQIWGKEYLACLRGECILLGYKE